MHPHLFQFGHFILPTFGALTALGLIVSLFVCLRVSRLLALDTDKVCNLVLLLIVVTLTGGKIFMAATQWHRYGIRALALPISGGSRAQMAALAAAALLGWIYMRKVHLPLLRTADALAPALAVAVSVIAIACFEAGYGFGTPTHLPWAVVFVGPSAVPGTPLGVPLHPVQLYESLLEFALFVGLLWLLHRPHADGEVMGAWLYFGGLGEFLLALLHGNGGGGLAGIGSPWIAVAMVVCGGFLWMRRSPAGTVHYAR